MEKAIRKNTYSSKLLEKFQSNYTESERKKYESLYDQVDLEVKEQTLVRGIVISIGNNGIIIDLGLKADGVLPFADLRGLSDIKPGDEIEVFLDKIEDKEGNPVISRRKANLIKTWQEIEKALEEKTILQGIVKRRTKGGLILDINGIETFLPGSQIDVVPVVDFDKFIGNSIDVTVIKIKYSNNNVVVSHKALIEKEIESQRTSIINNLEKGQILQGTVKNITPFGVFVDLGGVDGLLHITDISWSKVSNPENVFHNGQKIKVVVTDYDESKNRISLGMKQLTPHPWDALDENIKEGSTIKGKIVNITDYGVFLEIQKGVEGLIHVSEISWSQYVNNPRDYIKLGEEREAKVLSIDREAKKMSLSIKQLSPMPWSDEVVGKKYIIGSRHKGIVRNITNFGAFIELEPGLEGLLHISDLSWTKKVHHPSELLKVGSNVEIQVLTLDVNNRKLTLGVKQLEEDPWDMFENVFIVGSIHKGTVIKKISRGAIVELPYGIEAFNPNKGLTKENKKVAEVGNILDFKILEFVKDEHRVIISHTETLEKQTKKIKPPIKKRSFSTSTNMPESTLGDIEALSQLKNKISKKNNTEMDKFGNKSKKPINNDKLTTSSISSEENVKKNTPKIDSKNAESSQNKVDNESENSQKEKKSLKDNKQKQTDKSGELNDQTTNKTNIDNKSELDSLISNSKDKTKKKAEAEKSETKKELLAENKVSPKVKEKTFAKTSLDETKVEETKTEKKE